MEDIVLQDNLRVSSRFGDYSVRFLQSKQRLLNDFNTQDSTNTYFLIDRLVASKHPELYRDHSAQILLIEPTEEEKTLETVSRVAKWLIDSGADKTSILTAIGGGIVQDIATFVSSVYYRGIRWRFIPTTLLAMCDSSIGGKCAINHAGYKNQLGVVYPPYEVIICTDFLETLDEKSIISGFGEMLKLSLTGTNNFYSLFKDKIGKDKFALTSIEEFIQMSLMAKRDVIEEDEMEQNLRRILNYGHSFGHALESATRHSVTHGQAIVLGMDLINFVGTRLGITDQAFSDDFRKFAKEYFGLSQLIRIARPLQSIMIEGLKKDKKTEAGAINFAFAIEPGNLIIRKVDFNSDLKNSVEEYFEAHSAPANFS
jgi:3-dehydroquinate synthase